MNDEEKKEYRKILLELQMEAYKKGFQYGVLTVEKLVHDFSLKEVEEQFMKEFHEMMKGKE